MLTRIVKDYIEPHSLPGGALLSSAYFAPVQWWQKVYRHRDIYIERHDHFVKQTYRNRCIIATPNGIQPLTVPIEKPEGGRRDKTSTRNVRISDHGQWRRIHWNALCSSYGESPFFEYYADDIRPFFEQQWEYLFDFNMAITRKLCELLNLRPSFHETSCFLSAANATSMELKDYREAIRPKHPLPDPSFVPTPYYQVYQQRFGFQPNLSILDLLFNMGNEAVLYL